MLDGDQNMTTSMATNSDTVMMGDDYTIHPMLGAFRGLGEKLMRVKDVLPTKRCKAFDFDVPCPGSPEKTLFGMLLETGTERTCFALPVKSRLEKWKDGDWELFLKYQGELQAHGYENMGR